MHLFIEMPPRCVDVNVHPTKAEVRFREQSLIHEVIRRALVDALGRGPAPALVLAPSLPDAGGPEATTLLHSRRARRWLRSQPLAAARCPVVGTSAPGATLRAASAPARGTRHEASHPALAPSTQHGHRRCTPMTPSASSATPSSSPWTTRASRSSTSTSRTSAPLRADARAARRPARLESQRLLTPMVASSCRRPRPDAPRSRRRSPSLGLRSRSSGQRAARQRRAGAARRRGKPPRFARSPGPRRPRPRQPGRSARSDMAATIACHAAVKANYPLTREKSAPPRELAAHRALVGVPAWPAGHARLTRREIERNFQRMIEHPRRLALSQKPHESREYTRGRAAAGTGVRPLPILDLQAAHAFKRSSSVPERRG